MSDTSSGSDWELVTGTLESSHSFDSGSSSAAAAADGGAVDANVRSGYFATPTSASQLPPPEERNSSGGTERLAMTKPSGATTAPLEDAATFAVGDGIVPPGKQVEEIDFSRGILVSESCHELSKLDWMEPRSAGHELLEYEGSGLGSSTSNTDTHASEIQEGLLEPNSQPVGPLLGSCMAAPVSPSIVSRDNSFRLTLTDELAGDVAVAEVEPASGEHEMLLVHSGFISPNSFAGDMDKMGVVPLGESSASALGHERAAEIWLNKQAALRGVHGRQATAYWSIALAAAVMGLVILGHRWQHERRQNQQLRLRLHLKEEKIGQLVLQLARMKEMVTGRRRVPVLRSNFNGSFERY